MHSEELKKRLEQLHYPGLRRTLGELNLIRSVKITDDKADIVLLTISDDSYFAVKKLIQEHINESFSFLNITKKLLPQHDNDYGITTQHNNRAPYAKNIIAITSGKGGVGKSTVSVNLAIALAQKGYKVGLLDADVYGPNIPRLTQTDMQRIQWNDHNQIIPAENYGIKIMSVALTTPTMDTPLVWRSSVAVSALTQFLEDVAWGELDFMVIDMPPGTGDIQLTMAEELPITAALLVTTPQTISTDDVSRAIMMYKEIKVPMAGIIENMSFFIAPDTGKRYNIFGKDGGRKMAEKYNLTLLGKIPLDMGIRESSDLGRPVIALGNEKQKKYYLDIVSTMFKMIKFTL